MSRHRGLGGGRARREPRGPPGSAGGRPAERSLHRAYPGGGCRARLERGDPRPGWPSRGGRARATRGRGHSRAGFAQGGRGVDGGCDDRPDAGAPTDRRRATAGTGPDLDRPANLGDPPDQSFSADQQASASTAARGPTAGPTSRGRATRACFFRERYRRGLWPVLQLRRCQRLLSGMALAPAEVATWIRGGARR